MTAPEPAASLMAAIREFGAASQQIGHVVAQAAWGAVGERTAERIENAEADVRRLLALTREAAERYAEVCRNCPTGPLPADGHRVWTQRIDATRAELVALLGVDDDD